VPAGGTGGKADQRAAAGKAVPPPSAAPTPAADPAAAPAGLGAADGPMPDAPALPHADRVDADVAAEADAAGLCPASA
jgi:hypothetical protein